MSRRDLWILLAAVVVLGLVVGMLLGPEHAKDCASDVIKFRTGCP